MGIEHEKIDGQEVKVMYMTAAMVPCDKKVAELIKVIYPNGKHVWAKPQKVEPKK